MNIPARFWKAATAFVAVLIILAGVFIIKELKLVGHIGENPNQTNTISVDGTGNSVAVPDIATFSFSVTETAKTVADAQSAATGKINAALDALKTAGIADKDVSTESYNINPHYEYQNAVCPNAGGTVAYCPPGKSTLTGYEVSETIQVKVRDLSKAGSIFTTIGSLGVQNVNSLSFAVDKPESVQADARSKAIADARSKADALAKQLGVRLGRIVSFSENGGAYPRPVAYGMSAVKNQAMDAAPVPPQIPTGEQKITSTVSITYEIQ
ncbi:MAG: hypothetical protein JWO00_399 [Candidatus Parcubacteria bacterium]|nr:hypothetical protein [Candidatus Parcubacteria bacterium]